MEVPEATTLSSNTERLGTNSHGVNSVYDLLGQYPLVRSTIELQAFLEKGLTRPFDRGNVNGVDSIIIPNNMEELVRTNYLFRLYLQLLNKEKVTPIRSDINYVTRLKLNSNEEYYLKAFGIPIVTGEFPDLPSNHGMVWKGIMSSIRTYMGQRKNVDNTLLKGKELPHPALIIFGDVWGKSYPVEKRMLDNIVHYLRSNEFTFKNVEQYMIGYDQIELNKGLKIEYGSEVLSDSERAIIDLYLGKNNIDLRFMQKVNVDGNVALHMCVSNFSKEILDRQKTIKKVKDVVKSIVAKRVSACYAPYAGRQREKMRKTPIRELANQIKGTEYYKAFNPTGIANLVDKTQLPAFIPQTDNEKALFNTNLQSWTAELKATIVGDTLATSLVQEYILFLDNLKVIA
jgi:hypothetical protein